MYIYSEYDHCVRMRSIKGRLLLVLLPVGIIIIEFHSPIINRNPNPVVVASRTRAVIVITRRSRKVVVVVTTIAPAVIVIDDVTKPVVIVARTPAGIVIAGTPAGIVVVIGRRINNPVVFTTPTVISRVVVMDIWAIIADR